MDRPLDYEYFVSDTDMEVDITSTVEQTRQQQKQNRVQISGEQNKRQNKRQQVRYMSTIATQTKLLVMIGQNVCITGPAVEQYWENKQMVEGYDEAMKIMQKQVEKGQKRIAQLEKELAAKQVEIVTAQMETFSLQSAVAMNEQVIEEFTDKLRITMEELAKEQLDKRLERIEEEDDQESIASVD